jgi:transposase-like protein
MSKRRRRNHSSEQKAALLKRHHLEKVPVSDLCNEHDLQPSVFYGWQRQLFENAGAVFSAPKSGSSREQELEARIAQLEAKLVRKDAVIAEISEEYVALKKELGEP